MIRPLATSARAEDPAWENDIVKVQVIEVVDLPLDKAWPVFSDFSALMGAAPPGALIVDGINVGAERRLSTPDGVIVERLESLDPAAHTFTYAIINDDAPLPVSRYLGTVEMRTLGPESCEVAWSAEYTLADDRAGEAVKESFASAYRQMIRYLAKKAAG